jgi:hypothetical protein
MSDRTKSYVILVFLVIIIFFSFSIQHINVKAKQKELTQRNVLVILYPLIELNSESGLAYDTAIKTHHQLLTESLNYITASQRQLPLLSRTFSFPLKTVNIKKLKEMQKVLDETQPGEDEPEVRVKNASKTASELLVELQQLLSKPIIIFRDKNIPDELREKVDETLDNSHNKVKDYVLGMENNIITIEESVRKSEFACQESRKAISISLFVSLIYEDFFVTTTKLDRFWEDIERCIYYNDILCKSLTNVLGDLPLKSQERKLAIEETIDRLESYSESERRRQDILQAIIDDDMQKAQKLLLAAMDKAISEEKSLVEVR